MLRAFGEGGTGLFWVILSILVLLASLFGLVKAINLIIVGPIAKTLGAILIKKLPGPFKWVSQLLLFIVAIFLTCIVQSSNIITGTLVPLSGIGIISLQHVYVMTLGSNIGTTVTGLLTALAQPALSLKKAMVVAFVYTLFNLLGVLLWLPVPLLRLPKRYARSLGNVVFKYRWFIFFYIAFVYFVFPIVIFGLALVPHWIGLALVGLPLIAVVLAFVVLAFLQRKLPRILPSKLKTFAFLPLAMRSLKPYDARVKQIKCCCVKKNKNKKNKKKKNNNNKNTANGNAHHVDNDGEHVLEANAFRNLNTLESLIGAAEVTSAAANYHAHDSDDSDYDDNDNNNNNEAGQHNHANLAYVESNVNLSVTQF